MAAQCTQESFEFHPPTRREIRALVQGDCCFGRRQAEVLQGSTGGRKREGPGLSGG
jgi:hypothetical protein